MSRSLTGPALRRSGSNTTVAPCSTAQSKAPATHSEPGHASVTQDVASQVVFCFTISAGSTINSSGLTKEITKLVASNLVTSNIEIPTPNTESPTPRPENAAANSFPEAPAPAVVVRTEVGVHADAKPPLAQHNQKLSKTDFALGAGLIVGRAFDFVTTNECLRRPSYWCHEAELPNAIVRNHAAFALFEGGLTVLALRGQHFLIAHGRRKLSRFILGSEASSAILTDLRNWQIAK